MSAYTDPDVLAEAARFLPPGKTMLELQHEMRPHVVPVTPAMERELAEGIARWFQGPPTLRQGRLRLIWREVLAWRHELSWHSCRRCRRGRR